MKVGFIGLGAMGRPMARNLAAAGHEVSGWNRSAMAPPEGVALAGSARGVGKAADVTVIMVTDGPAVAEVLFGADGWCEGASPGAAVIQCSTIGPEAARAVAADLGARGFRMLDAPVSGSVKPAESGQLTVLGGGDPGDFARFSHLLEAVASRTIVFGPVGAGSAVKLAVNAILIAAAAAAAEALTWLADSDQEVDLAEVASVLERISPPLSTRSEALTGTAPAGGFSIRQVAKDMELIRSQIPGDVLQAVARLARSAADMGLDDRDLAALGEAARRRSNSGGG